MSRAVTRYGDSSDTGDRICAECGENLTKRHGVTYPTVHCNSQGAGYGVRQFSCKPKGVNPDSCHTEFVHHGKRAVSCPTCGVYLGCSWCLPPGPAICTRCHKDVNGERMMTREQARVAAKLLRMVSVDRRLTPQEAERLFREGTATFHAEREQQAPAYDS